MEANPLVNRLPQRVSRGYARTRDELARSTLHAWDHEDKLFIDIYEAKLPHWQLLGHLSSYQTVHDDANCRLITACWKLGTNAHEIAQETPCTRREDETGKRGCHCANHPFRAVEALASSTRAESQVNNAQRQRS